LTFFISLSQKKKMEVRQKVVEAFNKRWKPDITITCDDGEIISYNMNWILDSEYMNYVYDNFPSPRIRDFIIKEKEKIK